VESASLESSLDEITQRVRGTGLRVDATIDVRRDVPDMHRGAIVRIVQESLTNVMLHSSATEVRVGVTVDARGIELEVVDNGRPLDRLGSSTHQISRSGGMGLRSMEERATALGGRVEAGQVGSRGWRVSGVIPFLGPAVPA
jgi:signal transduction histidine kinase